MNGGSAHSRGLAGGSNHSRGLRRGQQKNAPTPDTVPQRQNLSGGSNHNRGLRRSQQNAALAPAVVEPEPGSGVTSESITQSVAPGGPPNSNLSGDAAQSGKMRGRVRATAPGAVSASTAVEPSLGAAAPGRATLTAQPSGDPGDGKIRGRAGATAPGAVSAVIAGTAEPSLGIAAPNQSLSGGGSAHGGKIRGRARATMPGAVSEAANGSGEPSLGASTQGSGLALKPKAPTKSHSPSVRPSVAPRPEAAPESKPDEVAMEDAQAIRRTQIQEIMKDTTLTQREKQLKMQQLMATGMPKERPASPPSPATEDESTDSNSTSPAASQGSAEVGVEVVAEDPQDIRRKQIQEIMKDTSLAPQERQAKIQQLMAGGMPKPAVEDPQTVRRKQVQEVMKNTSLTPQERQKKLQQLMASGNPKIAPAAGTAAPDSDERAASDDGSTPPENAPRDRTNSPSPGNQRRGLRRTTTGDSGSPPRAAGVGLRRTLSRDGSVTRSSPERPTSRSQTSPTTNDVTRPVPGADLGVSLRSGSIDDSSRSLNGASSHSHRDRSSRRERIEMGGSGHDLSPIKNSAAVPPQKPAYGVGGAPQGKMGRTTAQALRPGAVSVTEPSVGVGRSSTHEPETGVGGAPQGKVRRTTTAPASRPGATSVVEPSSSSPSKPGAATGVGGAPEGKIRRVTGTAASRPGAMSIVEPASSSPSEPGAAKGVGGAPQGKFRRSAAGAATPGAVSVVEPSTTVSEPGAATGVDGAPQGKFRRTAAAPAVVPGAVSMVEPSSTPSEPGAPRGVGGAPQGKFRRTTALAVTPAAVSSIEPTRSEPGGAPLDKSSHHGAMMGAVGALGASTSMQEPPVAAAGSARHLLGVAKVPRTRIPAVPVRSMQTSEHSSASSAIVSSIESDMLAKSNVRRSRPATTVVPGAQSVTSTASSSGGDPQDGDSAVISSIERDMLAKSNARGRRISAATTPGVLLVVASEPGQEAAEAVNSAEIAVLNNSRSVGRSNRGLGNAPSSNRGLGNTSLAPPSNKSLASTGTARGLSNKNFQVKGFGQGISS